MAGYWDLRKVRDLKRVWGLWFDFLKSKPSSLSNS